MTPHNQTLAWFRYPKFDQQHRHAVIIGAGIAGCQMAWHLVQQGWQVKLIDREKKIAQHASGNPAGIISPKMTAQVSAGEDFYVSCFDYAIQQLSDLKTRQTHLDWHACGLLQLAHNAREEQRWESLKDRCFNKDFTSEFLQLVNQKQSSEVAGIPINYKASYFPQAGWINPFSFCEALLKDCGVNCKVVLESDAISLNKRENDWQVIDQDNQVIAEAEAVIITTGKDLNQFIQTKDLPSMPVAGQTTTAPTNSFASQLKTTIGHEGYLTPASVKTSQLTFGASFDRNIAKAEIDVDTDQKNLNQLNKYLPELADSFTEIDSGHIAIRMTTPDRFPYVGGLADTDFYNDNYHDLHQGKQYKTYPNAKYIEGLFVLAGLGSRGLTTSGLCAKVLSDIMNNDSVDESPDRIQGIQENCHPARYIVKDLNRAIK